MFISKCKANTASELNSLSKTFFNHSRDLKYLQTPFQSSLQFPDPYLGIQEQAYKYYDYFVSSISRR